MNEEERKEQTEYEQRRAARRAARIKRHRRQMRMKCLLALGCSVLIVIAGWQAVRLIKGRKAETVIKETPIKKIVQTPPEYDVQLLTVNEYSRPGTALEKVTGIVVHYTANPGTTAQQNRDYFEGLGLSKATYASSHFVVGIEGELIQCIPCKEIAYASNDRNKDTIAIECCIPDETGKFSEASYQTLVHLLAWLMGRYDLDIDAVIRHYDVTEKLCPKYYVEHPDAWDALKEAVCTYIDTYGMETPNL